MGNSGVYRKNDRYSRSGCHDSEITGYIGENKYADHVGISCHPCPFSTQIVAEEGNRYGCEHGMYGAVDVFARMKALLGDKYVEVESGTDYINLNGTIIYVPDSLVDHVYNGRNYYLTPDYKGVWGYECVFPGCPHRIITGRNYFYV